MASEAERHPLGEFECQLCGLTAPYSYVGQKPPNTRSVVLLEESYVMKDPFSPDRDRFLVLGARCSVCSRLVCVGPVGMQSVLLQEVLSPLCPGEPWRLPSRDPAGPGEEEDPLLHAAFWPGLSQDLSLEPAQSPQCCQPHSWEQTCGRADWAPQEWPARSPALAPPG
ncbi:cysteine-rich DPF motif domain-containing protein 1 isoform X2 [Octodon degus]|uniref:Cysteine-rich DPF motif domain-containing protein 1 n=1 Tax=Octodon degus TaxID=10160 RepID=A0A6P6DF61_OCTDE|nr:cysteine-rich DPF motif domain-containing protein 1 isoform X2 [Octodon degus]XP_023558265.1 cysteine-rich DPF motif domain-containing protein 1 isoform X2 [Octodon degus]